MWIRMQTAHAVCQIVIKGLLPLEIFVFELSQKPVSDKPPQCCFCEILAATLPPHENSVLIVPIGWCHVSLRKI